jgi:hypothetical protein
MGTVFPDPRLVTAIVDRLTCNAHILETGTQPYRLRTSKTSTRGKRAADVATAESGPRRIRSRAFSSYVSPRTLPLPTCSTEIPLLSGRQRRSGPPGQLTRR